MIVPSGIIVIWSGAIVNIPAGWTICNGAGGSPDLRDKFIVGSGNSYAVGANGGNLNHTHPFTGDGHTHELPAGEFVAAGTSFNKVSDSEVAAGTTDNGSSLPPYYSLAYIMKQ